MGYVGLPLALKLQKYYEVCGFDVSKKRINELKKNYDSNNEYSKKILEKKKIFYSNDISDISKSDYIIVTVPTPVKKNNIPDLSLLKSACTQIANYLKKGVIIIFESTVFPTCTEKYCVPILEKISKKKINNHFHVAYSPERINVGDKKHTIDKITKIVGASSNFALNKVVKLYQKIILAGVYKCPNIKTAEAAKAIENAQRDINIAFINEVSKLFNKLGISSSEVLKASKTKWNFLNFTPGLVGGHCIGVDPYYLTYIANKVNSSSEVISSGRKTNDSMHNFLANLLIKKIKSEFKIRKFKILILGLSFKENTNDLRNSKVFDFIDYLYQKGHHISVIDPHIKIIGKGKNFKFHNNFRINERFHGIFLAVPHKKIISKLHLLKNKHYKKTIFFDLKDTVRLDRIGKLKVTKF